MVSPGTPKQKELIREELLEAVDRQTVIDKMGIDDGKATFDSKFENALASPGGDQTVNLEQDRPENHYESPTLRPKTVSYDHVHSASNIGPTAPPTLYPSQAST